MKSFWNVTKEIVSNSLQGNLATGDEVHTSHYIVLIHYVMFHFYSKKKKKKKRRDQWQSMYISCDYLSEN